MMIKDLPTTAAALIKKHQQPQQHTHTHAHKKQINYALT